MTFDIMTPLLIKPHKAAVWQPHAVLENSFLLCSGGGRVGGLAVAEDLPLEGSHRSGRAGVEDGHVDDGVRKLHGTAVGEGPQDVGLSLGAVLEEHLSHHSVAGIADLALALDGYLDARRGHETAEPAVLAEGAPLLDTVIYRNGVLLHIRDRVRGVALGTGRADLELVLLARENSR